MLKPAQKLVISLNLPWHRDAIRETCARILIEAAEKETEHSLSIKDC